MSLTDFWDLTLCSFTVTYCGKICCFSLRFCLLKHKQQVLSKQCHLFTKSHNTYNRTENLLSLTYQKPLRYTYPDRTELL